MKQKLTVSPNRQYVKPNFEARADSVVNRYSYSLPKKQLHALQKQTYAKKHQHEGASLIKRNNEDYNAMNKYIPKIQGDSEFARGTFGNDKHTFWNEIKKNQNSWDIATPLTKEQLQERNKEIKVS